MNKDKALKQLDLIMESFDKFYIYADENLVSHVTGEMLEISDEFTERCNKLKDIIYGKRGIK